MARDTEKATLVDVARVAGVSLATASRAMSTPQLVRPATLAKVLKAVQWLGYLPDGAARALASRRSRTVGAVVPTLDNPIFASSTQALQRELGESGYQLLIASHEYDAGRELAVTQALLERGVDALALVGTDHVPAVWTLLAGCRRPYVLTWSLDEGGHHPGIGIDNREAMARVARHLHDIGHREFAVISGHTAHNDRARARLAGVRAALLGRGIELAASRVVETDYSVEAARTALRALARLRPRPTAIVCGNDVLAQGAMAEAHALGLAVPADLSVTGFDDLALVASAPPGLTSVRIPAAEIGQRTARYLLARLAGVAAPDRTELPVELVVRGSTGPPPAAASRARARPPR